METPRDPNARPGLASHTPDTRLGTIAMLTCVLAWTTSPPFMKYFSTVIDLWTSNGWRYGAGAIAFLPWTILAVRRGQMPWRVWKLTLIPAVVNTVGATFFLASLYHDIEPAFSMLCLRSQVVFATLAAVIWFADERRVIRSRPFLFGMLMVLGGTATAVFLGNESTGGVRSTGILLLLIGAALFGIYGAVARKYLHGVPSMAVFGGVVTWKGIFMVALMVVFGERGGLSALDVEPNLWWILILSGIVGVTVGHGLYFVAIKHIGVALSHGMMELQPFLVAIVSYYLRDEKLTLGQWTGGLCAIGGVLLMLSVKQRLRHPAVEK